MGGCWSLIEAAVSVPPRNKKQDTPISDGTNKTSNAKVHSLWNREGLVRYSLACSQTKKGGLRDKPGTRPDAYHTCYSLAGLSAAQNHYYYNPTTTTYDCAEAVPRDEDDTAPLLAAFNWRAEGASVAERRSWCFDEADAVGFVHPVFVVPMGVVEAARKRFQGRVGF